MSAAFGEGWPLHLLLICDRQLYTRMTHIHKPLTLSTVQMDDMLTELKVT